MVGCGEDASTDGLSTGAECEVDSDCERSVGQTCLTGFQGGYCGIMDCRTSNACPEDSACALHPNGHSYCLRTCLAEVDCNDFRSGDAQILCSDEAPFIDDQPENLLACVPQLN